jgi:hypothetical protein
MRLYRTRRNADEVGMETHVVTIAVEFADARVPSAFSCELYRGTKAECQRLAAAIPGCSHDSRRLASTTVNWGTIGAWELWVATAQCVG